MMLFEDGRRGICAPTRSDARRVVSSESTNRFCLKTAERSEVTESNV